MKKKITDKDKKDWEEFLKNSEKLEIKDSLNYNQPNSIQEKSIDLHGYNLDEANQKISDFIEHCYSEGINKINIITGKGLRSKNIDNPYQSNDLSILKYSVPNFIKNNEELMDKILKIDFDSVNSISKGNFDVILKKNEKWKILK